MLDNASKMLVSKRKYNIRPPAFRNQSLFYYVKRKQVKLVSHNYGTLKKVSHNYGIMYNDVIKLKHVVIMTLTLLLNDNILTLK